MALAGPYGGRGRCGEVALAGPYEDYGRSGELLWGLGRHVAGWSGAVRRGVWVGSEADGYGVAEAALQGGWIATGFCRLAEALPALGCRWGGDQGSSPPVSGPAVSGVRALGLGMDALPRCLAGEKHARMASLLQRVQQNMCLIRRVQALAWPVLEGAKLAPAEAWPSQAVALPSQAVALPSRAVALPSQAVALPSRAVAWRARGGAGPLQGVAFPLSALVYQTHTS